MSEGFRERLPNVAAAYDSGMEGVNAVADVGQSVLQSLLPSGVTMDTINQVANEFQMDPQEVALRLAAQRQQEQAPQESNSQWRQRFPRLASLMDFVGNGVSLDNLPGNAVENTLRVVADELASDPAFTAGQGFGAAGVPSRVEQPELSTGQNPSRLPPGMGATNNPSNPASVPLRQSPSGFAAALGSQNPPTRPSTPSSTPSTPNPQTPTSGPSDGPQGPSQPAPPSGFAPQPNTQAPSRDEIMDITNRMAQLGVRAFNWGGRAFIRDERAPSGYREFTQAETQGNDSQVAQDPTASPSRGIGGLY